MWHRLEDVAARVYLYFRISGGWRMQELVTSAKYLSPVAHQSDWTEKAVVYSLERSHADPTGCIKELLLKTLERA